MDGNPARQADAEMEANIGDGKHAGGSCTDESQMTVRHCIHDL